jgi:hypothetical protein
MEFEVAEPNEAIGEGVLVLSTGRIWVNVCEGHKSQVQNYSELI